MNVTLYSNSGDPRQINKNLTTLGNAKTANATESIDVLRPTLKLVYDSNIIGANYLYIDTFGRYYFIDEKSIEGNLMTASQQEAHPLRSRLFPIRYVRIREL